MKDDQATIHNDRKSQAPAMTPSNKESGDRKGEEKKKVKSGRLAHPAGQGK